MYLYIFSMVLVWCCVVFICCFLGVGDSIVCRSILFIILHNVVVFTFVMSCVAIIFCVVHL